VQHTNNQATLDEVMNAEPLLDTALSNA